jgi:ribosome-associated translation inhibitor RaiA
MTSSFRRAAVGLGLALSLGPQAGSATDVPSAATMQKEANTASILNEIAGPRNKHLDDCILTKVGESLSELFATGGYRIGDFAPVAKSEPDLRVNNYRHITLPTDVEFTHNINKAFGERVRECFKKYKVKNASAVVLVKKKETDFYTEVHFDKSGYFISHRVNFGSDMLAAVREAVAMLNKSDKRGFGNLLMLSDRFKAGGVITGFMPNSVESANGSIIDAYTFDFSYKPWKIAKYDKKSGVPEDIRFRVGELIPQTNPHGASQGSTSAWEMHNARPGKHISRASEAHLEHYIVRALKRTFFEVVTETFLEGARTMPRDDKDVIVLHGVYYPVMWSNGRRSDLHYEDISDEIALNFQQEEYGHLFPMNYKRFGLKRFEMNFVDPHVTVDKNGISLEAGLLMDYYPRTGGHYQRQTKFSAHRKVDVDRVIKVTNELLDALDKSGNGFPESRFLQIASQNNCTFDVIPYESSYEVVKLHFWDEDRARVLVEYGFSIWFDWSGF